MFYFDCILVVMLTSLLVCDIMHLPHDALLWSIIMAFLGQPYHFKEDIF